MNIIDTHFREGGPFPRIWWKKGLLRAGTGGMRLEMQLQNFLIALTEPRGGSDWDSARRKDDLSGKIAAPPPHRDTMVQQNGWVKT
jgi:hypothetical protein